MKLKHIALSISLGLLSSQLFADHIEYDEIRKPKHLEDNVGPFIGIGIGAGVMRFENGNMHDHDIDPVMNLRAGVRLNDYIALLVTADFTMENDDKEHWELYDDYDAEYQTYAAGIELQLPITDTTRLHGMIGSSYWQIQHELEDYRYYDLIGRSGTSTMIRAGITHYLDDNLAINFEYMRPDLDIVEYEQLTVGFTVTF